MTTETKDPANSEKQTNLLSSEERAILSKIAAQEPPFSQRAQALLALDEGATQSAAGHQSGLSIGQVRYWLGKFRKGGTSIFPEELLDQAQQEDVDSPQDIAEPTSSPDTPDIEQVAGEEEVQQEMPDAKETDGPVDDAAALQADPPEDRKKSKKKSGKSNKSKKTKKLKQDKKAKKEKKSKKKAKKNEPKKGKKGKKSKKKAKKKKPKKEKVSKGKAGKKSKKKRKKQK